MFNRVLKADSNLVFGVILGLAAVGVVFAQIHSMSTQTTKTETTLFSILQFLLTVGFAWVLSRASFRKEFAESQKTFATAAYRRAREIESATNRLISRAESPGPSASPDLLGELDVILAISRGIRQAVKFSMDDWADVLGEEIETLQEIEELKNEEETIRKSPAQEEASTRVPADAERTELSGRLAELEGQVGRLRTSLPPAFRVLARRDDRSEYGRGLAAYGRQFRKQLRETGRIQLRGFWEEDQGFGRSIADFEKGAVLRIELADAGARVGAFILVDESSVPIGVITNPSPTSEYEWFIESLCRTLHHSRFAVKLVDIEPRRENRIPFTVETMPNAPVV